MGETILEFLSRQFTVEDIKLHPLAYQIYKKIISFDFLHDKFFPEKSRKADAEKTYHEAQKMFGRDGSFGLHYGRFYRKIGGCCQCDRLLPTGLTFYDSYQTRHSLGTALLEKYIDDACTDNAIYTEGVEHLEHERSARGASDAYPTSTLCHLLIKVMRLTRKNSDVETRLKDCINYGLKHFKDDAFFEQVTREYFQVGVRSSDNLTAERNELALIFSATSTSSGGVAKHLQTCLLGGVVA
ncbi:MAG: hypothetical protein IPQ01_09620 [Zoogloea sp.]|nr:hypothetical protein [Zoogloea sp.]